MSLIRNLNGGPIWASCVCVAAGALAFTFPSTASAQTRQDGERCLNEGNPAVSLDLQISSCTALIEGPQWPRSQLALPFFLRGLAYYRKNEYARAVFDFNEAIRLDPNSANFYFNRAMAYTLMQNYDQAIDDFTAVIRIDPKNVEAYNNRGLIYASKREYDSAIADYDRAIALTPQFLALHNRADAHRSKGEYDRAIADYDRAIQFNAGEASTYSGRAIAYAAKGDYRSAIADHDKAIELNPSAKSFLDRGLTEHAMGNVSARDADITRAFELANNRVPDAWRIEPKYLGIPETATTWQLTVTIEGSSGTLTIYTPGVRQAVQFDGPESTKDVAINGQFLFIVTMPGTGKFRVSTTIPPGDHK
jgi:tetratricopeptide (TPR) repeat protein